MAMEPQPMQQDPMQDPRAVEGLMKPSQEIQAVLVARLSNMSPDELKILDSAITPDVARILMQLLPELQEIINMIEASPQQPQQPAPDQGMGALGNM